MYVDNQLLRRPRPYPDESLAGYIVRLSDSNYYASPNYIFKMFGLRNTERYTNVFFPKIDDLSLLSHMSEVPELTLWSMAFSPVNPYSTKHSYSHFVKAFGENISTSLLHKAGPRFCPQCLRDKAYYRLVWHLSRATVCPFHKCFMVDTCDKCGKKVKLTRASLLKCRCGFDLRDCKLKTTSVEQFALCYHIYKLCLVPDIESVNYDVDFQYLSDLESQPLDKLSGFNNDLFQDLSAKDSIITRKTLFSFFGLERLLYWRLQDDEMNY